MEGFKRRHGVHRETYRYDDGRGEADELRQVLQAMERRQGARFSLAIRVATQMFTALMPMVRLLLKPGPLREAIAVVAGTEPREVFDSRSCPRQVSTLGRASSPGIAPQAS